MFTSAAIGMSWQLAVIVLLPIVGGYYIDRSLDLMPWITLLGLLIALAGSILVIRRALTVMNNFDVPLTPNETALHRSSNRNAKRTAKPKKTIPKKSVKGRAK
jgi:F0F1-type ATP synthase assembly protein I